ncbi:hypothetical protein QUW15_04035 [Desulfovibrio piger]|nr:hypothetical protein [Desulfovibrio piger]
MLRQECADDFPDISFGIEAGAKRRTSSSANIARLERFNFEKGKTRRRQHSAARPKVSGKTAFFRESTDHMA